MEKKFIRVRSIKDVIVFTLLIITGLVLVVIPENIEANLGGYTLIAIGAVLACILKSTYKDIETQKIYLKKEFSFCGEMKAPLLSALDSSPGTIDLSENGKGQVLMLKIYYSKISNKAFLQLFEYVPHQYESCSGVYEFEIDKVANLIK